MKKSIKLIKIGFAFIICILVMSCAKDIVTKKQTRTYITNYIFKKDVSEVTKATEFAFYDIGYRGGSIKRKESDTLIGNTNFISNQFIIISGFFPKSKSYFNKKGIAFPLWVDYVVSIVQIDSLQTLVEVKTFNSRIEVGEKLMPSFPHFGNNPKYKKVSSTTYEEYLFLHTIGKKLKMEYLMPPIE